MDRELYNEQHRRLSNALHGKTIMISGSTGLIGSSIVKYLHELNSIYNSQISVIGLYRDKTKLARVYRGNYDDIQFLKYNGNDEVEFEGEIDYVIHAAGISGGSKMHLTTPLMIYEVGIKGTNTLLNYAVSHGCRKFCYVSTYEVYGNINSKIPVKETDDCSLDPLLLRNSYAEVKRLCESLLIAYNSQYNIEVFSGRLTSTFGSGVSYNDNRFFAEFARCAIEGRDIILKSSGGTVRTYLDADDAAAGFLYILAYGTTNNAYNLTNMTNAISIRDMAKKVIELSEKDINLEFDIAENSAKFGFRNEGITLIDATKLEGLGWKPVYSIDETIAKMISSMKEEHRIK